MVNRRNSPNHPQPSPKGGPFTAQEPTAELDRLVISHRAGPRRFDLTVPEGLSIRNQMLRASLVVERLHAAGFVNDTAPLLVLGGGACGATAAVAALRLGISVVMVEKMDSPLRKQFDVARRIDAVEFDWPQPHWNDGELPGADAMPLPYQRGQAGMLAMFWEEALLAWVDDQQAEQVPGYGRLDMLTDTTFDKLTIHEQEPENGEDEGLWVVPVGEPRENGWYVGAALSCLGFESEKVELDPPRRLESNQSEQTRANYAGYPFWGVDTLEYRSLGLKNNLLSVYSAQRPFRVLVSGGGDGAQQDIQRVLTGKFGAELFGLLEPHLPSFNTELLPAVLAEDAARRAHQWKAGWQSLQTAMTAWHDAYVVLVDRIWSQWEAQQRVDEIAQAVLTPRSGTVHLTWVVGGAQPSVCFGLNRMLTQLTLRLHARQTRRAMLSSGPPTVNDVMILGHWTQHARPTPAAAGPAHQCGAPHRCLGVPHQVGLTSVHTPSPGELPLWIGPFHLIVVRHGVEPTPGPWERPPVVDQLAPYGLPC